MSFFVVIPSILPVTIFFCRIVVVLNCAVLTTFTNDTSGSMPDANETTIDSIVTRVVADETTQGNENEN